jgi:AP endonuclease-1
MPPKRTASTKGSGSKRKIEERDTDNEEETQRVESQSTASGSKGSLKRTKTEYFQNGQPKNKVLPVKITFDKKAEGTLRIATWNVCGFAASQKKVQRVPHSYYHKEA